MKTCAIALLAVAGTASANVGAPGEIDRSNYPIFTATMAGELGDTQATPTAGVVGPVFSNITGDDEGFFSVSSDPGDGDGNPQPINFDDYSSILSGPGLLDEFTFVGGVDTAGGVMFFDFFDAGQSFVDGFGVQLPSAGNFIWTIDITNDDVAFTADGFVQASVDDDGSFGAASIGTWFLTADDATIGDNGAAAFAGGSPEGADLNHAFELVNIPGPSSAALLGLGGLFAVRRRR